MAQECTGNSVATSSSSPSNWCDLQANSLSSWNIQADHNFSSSCEEDISVSTSFTNASNNSPLTVESSRTLVEPSAASHDLMADYATENQLWSHLLLGVGGNEEIHKNQEVGENFLDVVSSKSMTTTMFEPACDYLKKLGTSWEYNNSTSFNSFEKHITVFSDTMNTENERLAELSNLVSTWSIAPPDAEIKSHFESQTTKNMSLSSSMDHYPQSDDHPGSIKQTFEEANTNFGNFPYYGLGIKVKQENLASEIPGAFFGLAYNNISGYPHGFNSTAVGPNGKVYYGMPNLPSSTRNFADVITFNSRLGKQMLGIDAPKPSMRSLNLSESKKQGFQTSTVAKTNRSRGVGNMEEVKKKRSEDSSKSIMKKPKHDAATASSSKVQTPKVKLGDRITALQQIVSPFGKTDTASVLFEAIGYIKFLQEQVQLLSNPYLKTNSHKDLCGGFDRKNEGGVNLDLRSKGLCLVPISCTPQVYRDSSGPDYWTPAYRRCLHR